MMNRRRSRPAIEGTTLEPRRLMSGLIQQPPYVEPMRPVSLPDPGDSGTPPGDYHTARDPGLC